MNNQYQNLGKDTVDKINDLGFQVVESLFDIASPIISTVGGVNIKQSNNSNPMCNIKENDTEIKILFLLPGVKKEDINILLRNNELEVSAKTSLRDNTLWEHLKEKKFFKVIKIPSNIEQSDLNVKFENCVLKIVINKNTKNNKGGSKIEID
jgi:HSP20 family protein